MKKQITTIISILLLIGIVGAASTATLTNFQIVKNLTDFVAGGTTSTEFSFDYPSDLDDDYNDAPLVARINISCLDEGDDCPLGDCSVWKGDFSPMMTIQRYYFPEVFGKLLPKGNPIPMPCEEEAPIKFKPKQGTGWIYTINEVPNGTFYCYNPDYYLLQLSSRNLVSLDISSNQALYPGNYSVSVDLLEMEPDNSPPEIEFIIGGYIFGVEELIPIKLNVTDIYPIRIVQYKITRPILSELNYFDSGWINAEFNESSGLYEDEFSMTEYGLDVSGLYWIRAYACDILGNCREM